MVQNFLLCGTECYELFSRPHAPAWDVVCLPRQVVRRTYRLDLVYPYFSNALCMHNDAF